MRQQSHTLPNTLTPYRQPTADERSGDHLSLKIPLAAQQQQQFDVPVLRLHAVQTPDTMSAHCVAAECAPLVQSGDEHKSQRAQKPELWRALVRGECCKFVSVARDDVPRPPVYGRPAFRLASGPVP